MHVASFDYYEKPQNILMGGLVKTATVVPVETIERDLS